MQLPRYSERSWEELLFFLHFRKWNERLPSVIITFMIFSYFNNINDSVRTSDFRISKIFRLHFIIYNDFIRKFTTRKSRVRIEYNKIYE
jgi:hypothetical protein